MLILPSAGLDVSICLLRHARPFVGGPDKERALSPEGVQEAMAAKEKLKNFSFDLIITSSAARSKQTAGLIAAKAPKHILSGLYELMKGEADFLLMKSKNPPVENTLLKKIKQDLLELMKTTGAQQILIVAHAGVINLVGIALAPEHYSALKEMHFGTADGFILTPAL